MEPDSRQRWCRPCRDEAKGIVRSERFRDAGWSLWQKERLIDRMQGGWSPAEIAAELGFPVAEVEELWRHLRRFGRDRPRAGRGD